MRRGWMGAAALLPVAALAQVAGGGLSNYPTQATAEPFSETVHGVAIDDPYRWMERAERKADASRWMLASSAHTRAQLAALPGYAALLRDITAASKSRAAVGDVKAAGGRLFFLRLSPTADQPVLTMREASGRERVLLDPAAGGGRPAAIGAFDPTPDGRFVTIQQSGGGGEIGSGRILDVATGRFLADVLTPMWSEAPVWVDAKTLLYVRLAGIEGKATTENITLYRHVIGRPSSADEPLLGSLAPASPVKVSMIEAPVPVPVEGTDWTLGVIATARADARIAIARTADLAAGKPTWREVAGYEDRVANADIHGDTLYYITSRAVPDGEVRSVALSDPRLTAGRRVYGGGGVVPRGMVAARDGLYVSALRPDGSSRLIFLRHGSTAPVEVVLPFAGAIDNLVKGTDGEALVSVTGWLRDTQYYRLAGGRAMSLGLGNADDPARTAGARVIETLATSKDGTKVPLTILAPPATVTGARPTILETYSSYGAVAAPFYGPVTLTWVRRGGVFATCHARGGGEQGRAWHDAGREANKPRGHEDVIACGERLVAMGLASPATLGGWGTSAGGTIVPPAALARPDLFRAVTASVAMLNPTSLDRAENGAMQFAEFGDPRTPAGMLALAAQDTTLLLPRARGGPDFLFTVGLNDHRVPFWNSAKLAAAMRARWGDRHLALLRVDDDAGHGIGSGRDQTLALRADMYAFFLNRFGAPGFVR